MIKILLVGEYYSDNLGDPLLCRTVEQILKKEIEDVEIIPLDMSGKVSMTHCHVIKRRSRLQKFFMKTHPKLDKVYCVCPSYRVLRSCWDRAMRVWARMDEILSENEIDLVLFAGGELFMDYFAGIIYLIISKIGKTKVAFHACGMHEISKDSRRILKKVLTKKNVYSISLRDSYHKFCDMFPVCNKTMETYDTALLCSEWFEETEKKIADYGIGIINNEQALDIQKEIVSYFLNSSMSWKMITNGAEDDVAFAEHLLLDLGVSRNEIERYLETRPVTAEELVREVTKFKYIISFRMHSQIVAQSFGIPSFGIVWDQKIVEFYNKLNLQNNYMFLNETLNMDVIFNELNKNSKEDLSIKAKEMGMKSKKDLVSSVKKALII